MNRVLTIHPDAETVPYHADPVLAAIERHSEAWAVYQRAPEGRASEAADDETHAALEALLGTACATRAGAFCLVRHLRWWLDEESPNAPAYGAAWAIARAREADLSRLLGVEQILRVPLALPSGRLLAPAAVVRPALAASPVIEAGPVPSPALIRTGRALSRAGDVVAALVLVLGGVGLTGLASLL